jgi:LacI family transcriptional regulator
VTGRSPTIVDVARAAGVSTATVSRTLNAGLVSAAARERVQAAIEHLGYHRNSLARGLATGRTGVIGVIVPDVAGPLYAQMARGIEDVAEPLGLQFIMLTDNRSAELERAALRALLDRQVDGLVIIGSVLDAGALHTLLSGGPTAVLVEREGDATDFPTIAVDDEGGARSATSYLVERGHRRIAHVAGIRSAGARRLAGFRAALEEAGLEVGPVLEGDFTERSGAEAADALLAAEVSAVFCSNDRIALGLISALAERGIRVGRDLSLVGFDDLPFSAYLTPPLTTVRQDARALGSLAARQLVAALAGARAAPVTIVPTELVIRASVALGPAAAHEREVHPPEARQPDRQFSRRKA